MDTSSQDVVLTLRPAGRRAGSDHVLVAWSGQRPVAVVHLSDVGDDLAVVDAVELVPSERLGGVTGAVVAELGTTEALGGRSVVWSFGRRAGRGELAT